MGAVLFSNLTFGEMRLGGVLAKMPSALQHLYTIVVFMFAWLLFWIEDMSVMGEYLMAMFGVYGMSAGATLWELTCWEYWPVFLVCIVASVPVVPWVRAKLVAWVKSSKVENFLETDLPNPKKLETNTLCDYQSYLEGISFDDPKVLSRAKVFQALLVIVDVVLLVMLVLAICSVVSGSFNPFIYFRF